jgi:Leucine-rich repeat (LRR) protein
LTIHINSEYFEAPDRANGAPFKAILHLFQELGQVLRRQKKLTHLEIHTNSTTGQVYSGLRAVLKSRTLKSLRISGIPWFFKSADIPIKCRRLEELSLQGVYLNDEQSARHLWRLMELNPGLVRLKMAGARLTAAVLSMNMTGATLKQLRKIESLDLSSNDLGEQEVVRFVGMALTSDHPRLRRLDLSGNTRLGDEGCQRVIGLLMGRKCWLEELEVKNAGVNPRTIESVRTYLSRGNRRVYPL